MFKIIFQLDTLEQKWKIWGDWADDTNELDRAGNQTIVLWDSAQLCRYLCYQGIHYILPVLFSFIFTMILWFRKCSQKYAKCYKKNWKCYNLYEPLGFYPSHWEASVRGDGSPHCWGICKRAQPCPSPILSGKTSQLCEILMNISVSKPKSQFTEFIVLNQLWHEKVICTSGYMFPP